MIYWKNEAVGQEIVKKEGLFYTLDCDCGEETGQLLRLMAQTETGWISLGIPVPEGGKLRLRTRISVKNLPIVDRLELFPLDMEKTPSQAYSPEAPIPELCQGMQLRTTRQDGGKLCIVQKDKTPVKIP